jgi:hypothetical protein
MEVAESDDSLGIMGLNPDTPVGRNPNEAVETAARLVFKRNLRRSMVSSLRREAGKLGDCYRLGYLPATIPHI